MAVRKPLVRVSGRVTQLPAADSIVATDPTRVLLTSVGVANGVASLDGTGKVPSAQLPSYVDDVLEVASFSALPATGESGKIYVTLDTNYEYRWGGSAYVRLVASPGSSDAVPEGATNLYFTAARVLATVLSGLSVAAGGDVIATDNVLVAFGKIQNRLSQLGTAANANLTTSAADYTAGRVLKVGDYGTNGGDALLLDTAVNWDTITAIGEFFIPAASGTNNPASGNNTLLKVARTGGNTFKQYAYQLGSARYYSRAYSNGAWTAWDRNVVRGDIVGTVGWANGVPTGAIVEYGTNANGSFVRYADGTQICWRRIAVNSANYTVATYLKGSDAAGSAAFPAAFAAIPAVTCTAQSYDTNTEGFWASCYVQPTQINWGSWRALSTQAYTSGGALNLVAVGRWFV
jgi:hypothetical protein